MASKALSNSTKETVKRPAVRSRQIGVRLTEEEYAKFEQSAWKSGRTIGDWVRETVLKVAHSSPVALGADPLMTEIVALQLFLTNVLSPVACGGRMSAEQYQELMCNVKTNKHRAAREVVAQYAAENEEEKRHA
jgi:hypothetical protein